MSEVGRERSSVERAKEGSRGLRGTIAEVLRLDGEPVLGPDDVQVLKHHGVYQQEDRDTRSARKKAGLERDRSFMVRTRTPGGHLTPDAYLALDTAATRFADATLRLTTRQAVQFHGVRKKSLANLVRWINGRYVTTLGACGDVNRNTMACPVTGEDPRSGFSATRLATRIADTLAVPTGGYCEVWELDPAGAPSVRIDSPVYGDTLLPRKFKIGIAHPSDNCVDVLTQDIGIVPRIDGGRLEGFDLFVGGGLGFSHANADTFPRLASPLGTVPSDRLLQTILAIVSTQRDHGDRKNRKHARMKYLVEDWGIDRFRAEIERRAGLVLAPAHVPEFPRADHHLGWCAGREPGTWNLGIFVENGRLRDADAAAVRSGIREVVNRLRPGVRLTPNQDILFAGVSDAGRREADRILDGHGVRARPLSRLRTLAMACPALPTCGLALAEAERRLPSLIDELERLGHGDANVTIRMSGCPNSCSRPTTAEIAIIGRSPDRYWIGVGGRHNGTALCREYKDRVPSAELAAEIHRLLAGEVAEFRSRES